MKINDTGNWKMEALDRTVWRSGFLRVTRRRGRRGTQLVDDRNETRCYWKLEDGSSGSHYVENWLCKSDAKTRKKRYAASR